MAGGGTLVWLRRDLRLHDHAALHAATREGDGPVFLAFVFDTDILDPLPRADRRVELLLSALQALQDELVARGSSLLVRTGRAVEVLPQLVRELGVQRLVFAHDDDPYALARDTAVAQALPGVRVQSVQDVTVFERQQLRTAAGAPYTVFTPYKNAWLKALQPAQVAERVPDLGRLAAAPATPLPTLSSLGFEATDLHAFWRGGAPQARQHLQRFLRERLADYASARDRPAQPGTSGLSAALRFGLLSIRELVRAAQAAAPGAAAGASTWLSELIWRDFFHQVLFHHPQVVQAPLKPAYARIAWERGPEADARFQAWCEGRTGYPLVDAGMRQLRRTGFMHNRVRMLTASFLCKHLGVDWRRGEAWFAEQLLDFDLAANSGGWQWVAGCGCDAQPWFRIFNPLTQSEKFDPAGDYIARWVPELAALPAAARHAPWREAPLLRAADGYPAPIVDHGQARAATLARYAVVKAQTASSTASS